METNLVLALAPTAETESLLNAVQASLVPGWPMAEAWPPFIPLARLTALPAPRSLELAKAIPWERMDITVPWKTSLDGSGNLRLDLAEAPWAGYRAALSSILPEACLKAGGSAAPGLPEIAPGLVLAHGPGALPASLALQKDLVINAPSLAVFRFTESRPVPGIRQINWELLACHRVCKAR